MGMQIIHQSQSRIWMPVIYHLGNILIALWCNSSAREIRLTVEHQFCQKLQRDHNRFPLSGEYFVILLDSLTIRPWRDQGSDRNASGTQMWLIGSCHSVFLGTSSSCFIYISSCYAQVSLCRMYCWTSMNWPFKFVQEIIPGHSSPFWQWQWQWQSIRTVFFSCM